MIIREWRGRASPDRIDAYPEHFQQSVLPELRALDGFLGATLCRSHSGKAIEYLVLTRRRSLDAIRAFTGPDIGRAVVEPGAVAAPTDFDDLMRHYEVIEDFESEEA